jgi:diaminopimelate epimerase
MIAGGINISFAELLSPRSLKLAVHERGCGWTMACGTGACATVYDGLLKRYFTMGEVITVTLPGGELEIEITERGLLMWGPAREVFSGNLCLDHETTQLRMTHR